MKSTVMAAALLAALAIPAFAEEPVVREDQAAKATVIDPSTTSATSTQQSEMAPTSSQEMYGGCRHRSTALNMM